MLCVADTRTSASPTLPPRIPAVKSHIDYLTVHVPERRDKRILIKVIGE